MASQRRTAAADTRFRTGQTPVAQAHDQVPSIASTPLCARGCEQTAAGERRRALSPFACKSQVLAQTEARIAELVAERAHKRLHIAEHQADTQTHATYKYNTHSLARADLRWLARVLEAAVVDQLRNARFRAAAARARGAHSVRRRNTAALCTRQRNRKEKQKNANKHRLNFA